VPNSSDEYWVAPAAWDTVLQYLPNTSFDPSTVAGWIMAARGVEAQQAAVRWILQNLYVQTIECLLLRRHKAGWLFELTPDSEALKELDESARTILLTRLGLVSHRDEEDCRRLRDVS
jgi:hypothetical protein